MLAIRPILNSQEHMIIAIEHDSDESLIRISKQSEEFVAQI